MPKITLDAETFKVLASDTRLQLLKALDDRPKTVSELARELDLNKATVHEHLQQLVAGELLKKQDSEGRKWVYYTLSWKGKHLLHPENTTIFVLLSLGLVGSTAAVVQLGNWLHWWALNSLLDAESDEGSGDEVSQPFGVEQADEQPESGSGEPSGSEPSGSEPSDGQTADDTSMERSLEAPANGPEADGAWWDFLTEGGFWLFAVLFLMAMVAFAAAVQVRARAVRARRAAGDVLVGDTSRPA